jgi:U3 small nucleolar RNA-associated protein 10
LLRALFANLKEEALAFLAGVWSTSDVQELRHAALTHAVAFLTAHSSVSRPSVDFQTILPTLLAAIPTLHYAGRETAMDCVAVLLNLADAKPTSIYGFDQIYGKSSGEYILNNASSFLTFSGQTGYNSWK